MEYKANKARQEDVEREAQKITALRPEPKKRPAKPRVSYIDAICAPLIKTLEHSAGLPVHQLAGHAANVDFWVSETKHCLAVIDGYQQRFERLRAGQAEYEIKNKIAGKAPPIQRSAKHTARQESRRSLCQAIEKFLNRCHHEGLLSEKDLKATLHSCGMRARACVPARCHCVGSREPSYGLSDLNKNKADGPSVVD
ncbi:MAG: hypothetical protein FJ303_26895 [Planctomycetes bacterium]|nr:hypothetical protein [Planctomycetota bacterium]